MTQYWDLLLSFLHVYLVHACIATALMVAADVHQNGIPPIRHIPRLFVSATFLGSVIGFLTAFGHIHYLTYLKDL